MEDRMNTEITILFNNDEAVIDYLADLKDRMPLKILDTAVRKYGVQQMCFVRRSQLDNLFIVILWRSKLGYNHPDNKLILLVHESLINIITYFRTVIAQIPYNEVIKRSIIQEIISTLQEHKERIESMETQTNTLG